MVNAHCFIVPNGLSQVSKRRESVLGPGLLQEIEDVYGVKLDDSDLLVETWTLNPELGTEGTNNFECHGVNRTGERFPWCAPVKMFSGKKEGDVVSFSGTLGEFQVTLKQQGYRYQRFGNFEEVLNLLVAKSKSYVK